MMAISKADLDRMLLGVFDQDAKLSFLGMSREDQLTVILAMEGSNSNRLAVVEKWQIEFEKDKNVYRRQREDREKNDDDLMTNTQKMAKIVAQEFAKRFDFWSWFRDRILPTVVTIIVLAILYMAFGGKIPTP
jgi:hypothetical protein